MILITGGAGLVGSHFVEHLLANKHEDFVSPFRQELDVTAKTAVESYFLKHKPTVVVHYAAYTDVSGAEKERGNEKGLAWRINVLGTKNITEGCRLFKVYLIYLSTDHVFSGSKENPGPYREDDEVEDDESKVSWYGWTKIQGEKIIRRNLKKYAIVRIANPVRAKFEKKLDYVRKILFLFDQGQLPPLFDDQYLTLTNINTVSAVVYQLVNDKKQGVFHVSSTDLFTPFALAEYLLGKTRGRRNNVKKTSIEAFLKKYPSRYPQFGGLDTKKTQRQLGRRFLTWKETVDVLIREGKPATLFSP